VAGDRPGWGFGCLPRGDVPERRLRASNLKRITGCSDERMMRGFSGVPGLKFRTSCWCWDLGFAIRIILERPLPPNAAGAVGSTADDQ